MTSEATMAQRRPAGELSGPLTRDLGAVLSGFTTTMSQIDVTKGLPLRGAAVRALLILRGENLDTPCVSARRPSSRRGRKKRKVGEPRGEKQEDNPVIHKEQSSQHQSSGSSIDATSSNEKEQSERQLDISDAWNALQQEYKGDLVHDLDRIIRLRQAIKLIKDYLTQSTCLCDDLQRCGAANPTRQQSSSVGEEHDT